MSATSIISREVVTSTSSTVAEEFSFPAGTNSIMVWPTSDDASVTVEINEQTGTPEDDAEFYQVTKEQASLFKFPFYSEMETLFITSPVGSTYNVEFRSR